MSCPGSSRLHPQYAVQRSLLSEAGQKRTVVQCRRHLDHDFPWQAGGRTQGGLRTAAADKLGLTNIRILKPDAREVAREDGDGKLWSRDSDACCSMRKVRPLDGIIGDYDALITGRKRFHGGERMQLPAVERVNGTMRINPLARWSAEEVQAHFRRYDLPRHPLTDMGYASIGCWTCTAPARDDDVRSGRWAGQDKTECGIHRPLPLAAE